MHFTFNKNLYNKTALLKAAYNFTDKAYIHLDVDEKQYIVDVEMKEGKSSVSEKDFLNEMITQMVRLDVQQRTKTIRELTLARAFSSTIIENNNIEELENDEVNINDILQDWFEKYE